MNLDTTALNKLIDFFSFTSKKISLSSAISNEDQTLEHQTVEERLISLSEKHPFLFVGLTMIGVPGGILVGVGLITALFSLFLL